jgi:DNA-binding NtrC family response regulator
MNRISERNPRSLLRGGFNRCGQLLGALAVQQVWLGGGQGMADGLDVIIVDDEASVCETVSKIVSRFYTWGDVLTFTDVDKAVSHCLGSDKTIAIFVVDVFLVERSGFHFLDTVQQRFPTAHYDSVMITGNASDDVVDMCVASDVNHLLEKPIKPYALQLAVRAILQKYLKFAKKILQDPVFAESVARF